MKILKKAYIALLAGLLIGWAWGLLEGGTHLGVYFIQERLRSGSLPPFSLLDLLAIPIMAGALYSLVLAVLSLGLTPAGAVLFRFLPRSLAIHQWGQAATLACFSSVLFFNLYWWTRPLFFYGLRFYDPRRLAMTAVFALVSLGLGLVVVKAGARLMNRQRPRPALQVLVLLVLFSAAAIFYLREEANAFGSGSTEKADEAAVNVVLVVPDALRADHLGCYGYDPYESPVSPFLDRLAGEGVLFEQAVTQAPFTWTSFGSFLTGKFPRKHGLVRMDPTQRLNLKDNYTLAEFMNQSGRVCGAFLMGTISNNNGLLQGFDIYFEAIVGHDPVSVHSKWSIFRSDLVLMRLYNKIKQASDPALVNTLACDFVRQMKDRPFFLLVHYYATHTPYDPPEPYKSLYYPDYEGPFDVFTQQHNFAVMEGRLPMDDNDLRRITALYDGGVTFEDDMIRDLYNTLEDEGLLDRTLFMVTSDHGEELYDHRVFEHDWMYNTNQLVPLIIRFPGGQFAGKRVSTPVGLIDLVPTVEEVTGFPMPPEAAKEVDGQSLLRHLQPGEPLSKKEVYSFCENNRYISVQDREFKLIRYRWTDRDEADRLFHLAEDPGETKNCIERFPEAYQRLDQVLRDHDQAMPKEMKTYGMDPELFERLQSLGYIQGNIDMLEGEIEQKGEPER